MQRNAYGGGAVIPFQDMTPEIADDAFIAPGAHVIGDVTIGARSSIWFNTVLRGDVADIVIGEGTNIQDGTVVHVTTKTQNTRIGNHVLVGHMALIHGCELQDHAFVGLCTVVMDGCVIESKGMLAAGAMLTPGKVVPSGELWGGRPARFMRKLTEEELQLCELAPAHYAHLAEEYRKGLAS
ncbi:MAG: gamma carbonic anhydrase family protein [Sphingomonadales bacterium]|nr:gamma carbonic anhydrase family protein [Sphingomonadales bacterium]